MFNNPFKQSMQKEISTCGSHPGSHKGTKDKWAHQMALSLLGIFISLAVWVSAVEAAPYVEAPEFELVTLEGETYSKASFRGQPTLLVFWAPWCHFCQLELPILAKFFQEDKPDQLRILTIAFADTRANVETYVKANPDTFVFPTAYDSEDRIAQRFGVKATPTFVVMNEHGDLVLAHFGARLNHNPKYLAFLDSLKK